MEATSPIVARRLLQYSRKIFQYAQITGRFNMPDFTDGLKQVLRTPKKGHFPALELDELPEFLEKIFTGKQPSILTTEAMKLMLYTFPRTNELLRAKKAEVNFDTALWIIPAERMKMKLPHMIPLSKQAIEILRSLFALTPNSAFIFPSINNPHKPYQIPFY